MSLQKVKIKSLRLQNNATYQGVEKHQHLTLKVNGQMSATLPLPCLASPSLFYHKVNFLGRQANEGPIRRQICSLLQEENMYTQRKGESSPVLAREGQPGENYD